MPSTTNMSMNQCNIKWVTSLACDLVQTAKQADFAHKHGAVAFLNRKTVFKSAHNEHCSCGHCTHNWNTYTGVSTVHAEMASIRNMIQELMKWYVLQVCVTTTS